MDSIILKSEHGQLEITDIDEFEFSDEALKFIEEASVAASLFFTNEIDMDDYTDSLDEDVMAEINEVIILGDKFSDPIRALALKAHLNVDNFDNIDEEGTGDEYRTDEGDFIVLTDDEATEKAQEYVESSLEDLGLSGVSEGARDYAFENFVDKDWFETAEREGNESYAYDIKDESSSDEDLYVSRLHEEMVERSIMDEPEWPEEPEDTDDEDAMEVWESEKDAYRTELEGVVENKIDEFIDDMAGDDPIEKFRGDVGDETFRDIVNKNNLLDVEGFAEWIIEQDGRGPQLSPYDGVENEETITYKGETETFYIYRTN